MNLSPFTIGLLKFTNWQSVEKIMSQDNRKMIWNFVDFIVPQYGNAGQRFTATVVRLIGSQFVISKLTALFLSFVKNWITDAKEVKGGV